MDSWPGSWPDTLLKLISDHPWHFSLAILFLFILLKLFQCSTVLNLLDLLMGKSLITLFFITTITIGFMIRLNESVQYQVITGLI